MVLRLIWEPPSASASLARITIHLHIYHSLPSACLLSCRSRGNSETISSNMSSPLTRRHHRPQSTTHALARKQQMQAPFAQRFRHHTCSTTPTASFSRTGN
jgi:hypothetical protein